MRPLKMIGRLAMRLTGREEARAQVPTLPATHTSVVTGASSGIGTETAKALACAGGTVWLVGRNPHRLEAAACKVRASAGHERVHALRADFSRLTEVRRLAADLLQGTERIDVLVNNAGLWALERRLTAEGFEQSLGVNHLAPFVLTTQLLERLEASGARVVNVSSRLHRNAQGIAFDDPAWERRPYRGLAAYAESKLANVLFANALARRLSIASSTSLHPGDIATDVVRDSRALSLGIRLVRPMLLTPEEGAQCSLHAAVSEGAAGRTGVYFSECEEVEPAPLALDEELQERLWSWSERATAIS